MTQKMTVEGSSTIKYLEYDASLQELTVTFSGGSQYAYMDVPADVVTLLFEADSKGKYFSAHIKEKYVTEKILGNYSAATQGSAKPQSKLNHDPAWPFPTYSKP